MAPLALATIRHRPGIDRRTLLEQGGRALLVLAATLLFVVAITRVPLADAIGAYLIGPIVASALAVLVLGEPWSSRRAVAVAIGFVGAVVIVRPGVSIEAGFLYALGAGACFGGFLVASRACRRPIHPFAAVAFQMSLGSLILTPFAWPEAGALLAEDWWLLALIGLPSAVANVLVDVALAMAPAAFLAPLVYLEIVGAVALGFVVFGDVPSVSTAVGTALVVIAGLFVARQSALARPATSRLRTR